jgi:hypothetical protein
LRHGNIIRSGRYAEPSAQVAEEHASSASYDFEFYPSHGLSEAAIDKRVAKIRRVLNKLTLDVTAPEGEHED